MAWLRYVAFLARVCAVSCALTQSSPLALGASRAAAQASELDTPEYQSTVQRAVSEFGAGNYAEARALFTQAHALYPNARTFRGLGWVAYELRNYRVCVENLEAALASTEKPLTAELRKTSEEALRRARSFIGQVDVELIPGSARLLVDGAPVEVEAGNPLVLEVGDHVFEAHASGYLSERRTLSIAGGEKIRLEIVMHQPEVAETAGYTSGAATPDDTQSGRRRWYKSPWLWTSVAVVAAGAGTALALLALRPSPETQVASASKTERTPTSGIFVALVSR